MLAGLAFGFVAGVVFCAWIAGVREMYRLGALTVRGVPHRSSAEPSAEPSVASGKWPSRREAARNTDGTNPHP